jgi:ribosomal protein L40E
MSNQEKQIVVIQDIVLPADYNSRYDLYVTDRRIAIVCMGLIDRYGYDSFNLYKYPSSAAAVTPPLTYVDERDAKLKKMEEELGKVQLDDLLKLSKKSCEYTNEEIEALKLGWGKNPKFIIQSEDCESRLSPNQEQFTQLIKTFTSVESLSKKLKVAGNWLELKQILTKVVCSNCGFGNDLDSVCCENCGEKIVQSVEEREDKAVCGSCGKKNSVEANFCKQCGTAFNIKE